jgi:nitroreductase
METMKTIALRQSSRAYTGEQISDAELQTIVEAANAAPVGMGKFEDMKLTVIQNKEMLAKFDSVGARFYGNPDMHPLYGAPTVILVSAKDPGVEKRFVAYCNAACIVENMALAATDLGLGNVYLLGAVFALESEPQLKEELKVPEGYLPASAIAIGKAALQPEERNLTTSKIEIDYVK